MFERATVAGTHGYYPLVDAASDLIATRLFTRVLVLGPGAFDFADTVDQVRHLPTPDEVLPEGVYWFTASALPAVLVVYRGRPPSEALQLAPSGIAEDSLLGRALQWHEHLWHEGKPVPSPVFGIMEDVLTRAGQDGLVRARQYTQGQWVYSVYVDGRNQKISEDSLTARPLPDSPDAWVDTTPASADRFAATLTRAKLEGRFTDTVFSFRATRTIFRPYQFKPVLKLLNSGSLRMLIADEVGLGKTIEAGLLWTELEARQRADRVLVVCPSSLLAKWQREMDERFGFTLVELTNDALIDLKNRVESDRVPRRIAYVCTVERLRRWDALAGVTDLGLEFDLVIVDEAHVFRNWTTKSHELGVYLSQWADAMVFLSATPVNLRNDDLFNLLELLVPGEFLELEGLRERIEPNSVLHRVTGSLLDRTVTNETRRSYLEELGTTTFGRVLTLRPEYELLKEVLERPELTPADVVQVKRICSELHGLSSQITRTRKVEVQDDKAVREPRPVQVEWTSPEREFYDAFREWCVARAKAKAMPLHFAMQMPLRLAGSCLPEAARQVLEWQVQPDLQDEIDSSQSTLVPAGADVDPSHELVQLAAGLTVDTKLAQFDVVMRDLVDQGKQALVFTFSRRTLAYLERHLRGVCRVGVLHGGVQKRVRDEVMADFRAGGYDVVIATKVASEGLDFEFCSVLVNYDLPWNPMEIEQRIGRIDRIGQREDKMVIVNFTTPGTIETDILERVLDRIGVFEHAIGALEPIIGEAWSDVEAALLDFELTPEQREQRTQELLAALAEQERALVDVETAAPYLISSDGVDIEGLEPDLVTSGRYVGQRELALLVSDWIQTYGGSVHTEGDRMVVTGNPELSDHVQGLARTGERTGAEVSEVVLALRNEQAIHLSLDQETSRLGGVPLIAATHPLVRAALNVPGYRQSRFSVVAMTQQEAETAAGCYLVQLCVAHWDGIRPIHEVWTETVNVDTGGLAANLGDRLMAMLAAGELRPGRHRPDLDLSRALSVASDALLARQLVRKDELRAENEAFMTTRRVSIEQVHQRRIDSINQSIETLRANGRERMIRLFEAQRRREDLRYAEHRQDITERSGATLRTEDLAVCIVEVG